MGSLWMEKYIGVVAHDAGGANVLSSYCKRMPGNYRYFLQGPAKAIFSKNLSVESEEDLEKFVSDCHRFLIGTSGNSDFERSLIVRARKLRKETIAILDHWTNYRERFILSGDLVLPDKFITLDKYAFQIAKQTFPECNIEEINNPYLEEFHNHFVEMTSRLPTSQKSEILYISEGFSEQNLEGKEDSSKDFEYFQKFLNVRTRLFGSHLNLRIRLHPSEDLTKFEQFKNLESDFLQSDSTMDLALDLSRANCVVGVSSMALVLASVCGVPTFSLLSNPEESKIPIPGINYIGLSSNFK